MSIRWLTIILVYFISLFNSGNLWATLTLDTSGQSAASTLNPLTLSYTCGASAKVLVLSIATATTTQRSGGAPTYNGVTMTQIGSTQVGAAECTSELWYLFNPTTGSAVNISVPNAGGDTIRLGAASFNSSGTNLALEFFSATSVTAANPSLNMAPNTYGGVVVDSLCDGNASSPSANSQTLLFSNDNGVWSNNMQYALPSSRFATFSWTVASDDVAYIAVVFTEQGAGKITGTSNLTDALIQ